MPGLFGRPKTRALLPEARDRFRNALLAPNAPPGSTRDPLGPWAGPQEPSLRSYTPNPAERAQNALAALLTAGGQTPGRAGRLAETAVGFTPIGTVRDVRDAGWQTYRGARDGDRGETLGGILGAALAVVPIPLKQPAKQGLGEAAEELLRPFRYSGPISNPSTVAKRLRAQGIEATADSPITQTVVSALAKQRERSVNRPSFIATAEGMARARERRLADFRAARRFTTAPAWEHMHGNFKSDILARASFDPAGAEAIARLGVIEAITRRAKSAGWTVRHTSKEGRASSRYLRAPSGAEVRVSDHFVPQTAQRDYQAAMGGGPRWTGEIVVGSDWRDHPLDDWLARLDELARGE